MSFAASMLGMARGPERQGSVLGRYGGVKGYTDYEVQAKMRDPDAFLAEDYGMDPAAINTWYLNRAAESGQLNFVSPDMSGATAQYSFEGPLDFEVIRKSLLTSTSGAFNALFSYLLISQIIQEPNTWNALPDQAWRGPRTLGYRVKSAAFIASSTGIAQAASVPADIDPTYIQVTPTIKELAIAFGVSLRMADAVQRDIVDGISFDQHVEQATLDFFKANNKDLWIAPNTAHGNNLEGIRQIVSSYSEGNAKTYTMANISPWGNIDRSGGAGWSDANILHNSGTARAISVGLIEQLRQNQEPYWSGPDKTANKWYFTTPTQHVNWSLLEAAKQRYGTEYATLTVGGVKTAAGHKSGYKVASWDEMGVIRDVDVYATTNGDVVLLDFDHFYKATLRPFEMAESDRPFEVGYKRRATWYGIMEILCDLFKAQGALTDLS